jgi:hypothetical protein
MTTINQKATALFKAAFAEIHKEVKQTRRKRIASRRKKAHEQS